MTEWSLANQPYLPLVPGWYVLNPGLLVPHIRPKTSPHTWALLPYDKGYLTIPGAEESLGPGCSEAPGPL